MKGWKKIEQKKMKKIKGGGFWISFWTLSLATFVVARSLFSEKASVTLNGVGRASWQDKDRTSSEKKTFSDAKGNENGISSKDLEAFYAKFYEV